MAPREVLPDAYPLPLPQPGRGPVTGFGTLLNYTTAAEPYTHGLLGVSQARNWLLANVLLISFFVLLAITLGYRWVHMANSHLRHLMTMGKWEDQRYWMYNHSHVWPRIKRSLLYAPLWKHTHNREVQLSKAISIGTLPGRYHTLLLVLYCASNLAYCLALDWGRLNSSSVVAELRGRSGVLGALNLIPTVLFALRNNPLIPILRVSYDTFNLFHRWCARMVIFEAVVHTVCWAANALEAGGMHQVHVSLSTSTSYTWGMVATVTFGFVFLTSFSPLRHAFYETFLNVHRLTIWLALVGVYVHLDKANLPQLPYVQLCMALWVAEWLWRAARICYHNLSRQRGITKVTIEALPAEACRVTFELSRPWHWKPGCHVHAYLPQFALWSSHPFSIAWAESRAPRSPLVLEVEMEKMPPAIPRNRNSHFDTSGHRNFHFDASGNRNSHFDTSGNRNSHFDTASAVGPLDTFRRPSAMSRIPSISTYSRKSASFPLPAVATISEITHAPAAPNVALPRDAACTSISLIIRARSGMTRQLYDRACAAPTGTITTWGAIEGPYGGHDSLASFGTVVLFAGGVGITHCVGYVHHLMLQHAAGTASTQKVLLVWSVPNTEALEWVRVWMDRILRMEGRREVLRIQIFVTKPRHRGEVISNTGSVAMFPGRCNPETILKKEMGERIGCVGVTVCGPGAFADSVRSAVRGVVRVGAVEFVEEAFTY
ncbi:hypothetical protein LTR08_006412 [Meristemomyces frigidus]|nr:hypothetical protein LTR08_006412 [Meristemomyces frigidus]